MGLIPESTLEEILSRVDIVELISGYIPLKKVGRSYKALCPFHHEKTPSFIVNPDKQIFHCFGCSAGGNAFGFLMQHERLEFPEAIEALAKRTGVIIHEASAAERKTQNLSEQLYKINEAAADFYSDQLHAPEGEPALKYLLKRGLTKETIQRFKIGYAQDKWDGLLNYLRSKGFVLGLIDKSGLIIAKDNGGYYDRFRKRILIPIHDTKGRTVAFGARVLDNSLPKYINSPETPVYSKSKVLFGLDLNNEEIRLKDLAVIVEGYFDLIFPYQAGVKNITASCGTALTQEQIRLLKRYSRNVVLVYDSDNAGQMATLRSIDTLIEEGLNVMAARLPEGYDPDSFARQFGPEGFQKLITEAKDIFDYKLEFLKSKYAPLTIPHKARAASEMLSLISKFNNTVAKSAYIKKLAEELSLDENSLLLELKKTGNEHNRIPHKEENPPPPKTPVTTSAPERMIVRLILEEQELIEQIKEKLAPGDFQDKNISQIITKMFDLFCSGKKINTNSLINHFTGSHLSKIILEISTCEWPAVSGTQRIIDDCVRRIKESKRKLKQQELCRQLKLAQGPGDELKLNDLLIEFQSLSREGA
ncbi:MAG: DNA primase [Candidatus Omnitrophota bacterium]|nr:DNA primase [Candidatus Omnitrophota bacterium]